MFNVLIFARRKSNLTQRQFIDAYEGNHPAFAQKMVRQGLSAEVLDYRRHYLMADDPLSSPEASSLDFDVVISAVYETRQDVERMVANASAATNGEDQTSLAKLSADDFKKWLDPGSLRFVVVEERVGNGASADPALRK
jgi:EthD domain